MSQGIKYAVDIIFCIDATGSMSSVIDNCKNGAKTLHADLTKRMQEKDKKVDLIRCKVIVFRDFYFDGDNAISESPFYILPENTSDFEQFVKSIYADGGGDEPESSLEALSLAMKTDFINEGYEKTRQIIVLYTDASAHPLEKNSGSKPSNYPQGLPSTIDEFSDLWHDLQSTSTRLKFASKRLLMYAPDTYPYTSIGNDFDNTIHYVSKAGDGLSEIDYSQILDAISSSV